jgi:thiosulfate/3-mercaptopyruvate sulfurtransferase
LPPSPLFSPLDLVRELGNPQVRIVDCRYVLGAPTEGRDRFEKSRILGAIYADLEKDLSGPIVRGVTGRHPLPDPSDLAQKLGNMGISNSTWVVAYDQNDGSMAAARLWWLLRYLGHKKVSVLEGGLDMWQSLGLPCESGEGALAAPSKFEWQEQLSLVVSREEVSDMSLSGSGLLLDARAPQRFSGEVEPIDARRGHIPNATNLPYAALVHEGKLSSPADLKHVFHSTMGETPPNETVVYCGSGVTACHLLLAAEVAGISGMRLYPGSFSEWIVAPDAIVETGTGGQRQR